mgnify:FL=1
MGRADRADGARFTACVALILSSPSKYEPDPEEDENEEERPHYRPDDRAGDGPIREAVQWRCGRGRRRHRGGSRESGGSGKGDVVPDNVGRGEGVAARGEGGIVGNAAWCDEGVVRGIAIITQL